MEVAEGSEGLGVGLLAVAASTLTSARPLCERSCTENDTRHGMAMVNCQQPHGTGIDWRHCQPLLMRMLLSMEPVQPQRCIGITPFTVVTAPIPASPTLTLSTHIMRSPGQVTRPARHLECPQSAHLGHCRKARRRRDEAGAAAHGRHDAAEHAAQQPAAAAACAADARGEEGGHDVVVLEAGGQVELAVDAGAVGLRVDDDLDGDGAAAPHACEGSGQQRRKAWQRARRTQGCCLLVDEGVNGDGRGAARGRCKQGRQRWSLGR